MTAGCGREPPGLSNDGRGWQSLLKPMARTVDSCGVSLFVLH